MLLDRISSHYGNTSCQLLVLIGNKPNRQLANFKPSKTERKMQRTLDKSGELLPAYTAALQQKDYKTALLLCAEIELAVRIILIHKSIVEW